MKKRKLIISMIFLGLIAVALALGIVILHSYKQQSSAQPEDLHLRGDGVYFNVFTEDTRNETAMGMFENVSNDTVFYASIQNSGKERDMQLTAYLDYEEVPITILEDDYKADQIHLKDQDNIVVPFKVDADINPDQNHKFLISLFFGTDVHASEVDIQSNRYALSYDYFIKNCGHTEYSFNEGTKADSTFCDLDFPSVMLNTDFDSSMDGVKQPTLELEVMAGEKFDLAYRIGKMGDATQQLLIVTIDYHQAQMNGSNYLLVDTKERQTAFGTVTLEAPSQQGLYEICALVVPDPSSVNPFVPLENAYRFTLRVS